MTNEEIKIDINILLIKEGKQKKDIAERLGISRQGLTNILNKKHITIDDITKIADAVGYDVVISYKKRDI
jgi:transcriptional regulator with XRE-family HTH domain